MEWPIYTQVRSLPVWFNEGYIFYVHVQECVTQCLVLLQLLYPACFHGLPSAVLQWQWQRGLYQSTAGCFNPPLSRWNAGPSSPCSRSASKMRRPPWSLTAVDTRHQSMACSRTQTSASLQPDPSVSGLSIYTLCIFTTAWMIRMVVLVQGECKVNVLGYSKKAWSWSEVTGSEAQALWC